MDQHYFNIEIATKHGVNEAIFLNNIAFWIQKNVANNKHFYDNYHWTYNSQAAFIKLFPYWSRQNLRTIISSCEKQGLIKIGIYNEKKYDKTTWYAFTDKGLNLFPTLKSLGCNQPMDLLEPTKALVRINQPIPDNKPDNKPDIKNINSSDDERELFDQFWLSYPKKQGRERAWKIWKREGLNKIALMITGDVQVRHEKYWRFKHKDYIPMAATYLSGKQWEDELIDPASKGTITNNKESYHDQLITAGKNLLRRRAGNGFI